MIRYLFILLLLLAVAYILKHYNRNLEGMAGETCNMTDDKKPGYVDVIKSGSQRYSEIYTSCNEAITRWNKTCLTNCSNPTKIDGNCGRHLFRKDNTNFKKKLIENFGDNLEYGIESLEKLLQNGELSEREFNNLKQELIESSVIVIE